MTSRERIRTIIAGKRADQTGFWLGNPHWETWPILHRYFGTTSEEELRQKLGDDFRWIQAGEYRHPDGKPMFNMMRQGPELSAPGCFADCDSVVEVEDYDWPDINYLDFSGTIEALDSCGETYRASGLWSPFFHEVCDFFGMENYFTKMYTHPDVVHAVTRHIVDFYVEANRRFFRAAGNGVDGFFLGNDFGAQNTLLISPDLFREFVLPYLQRLIDVGKHFGHQIILHSCGSIYQAIPDLIASGIDALHPLQAKASRMDADTLASEFKGKVAFIGCVDTQELLVNGSPEEVKEEVNRLKETLGPSLVISPSHEALLPNVRPANVQAMAEEAVVG